MKSSTSDAHPEAVATQTQSHTSLAGYFKEVIYGGIDGIITTFAVVAGFSGAAMSTEVTTQMSFMVVLLFGLANLFADGVSMGLGNFLSVRSEQDLYNASRRREVSNAQTSPEAELNETIAILVAKGYSSEDAATIASLYKKNEDYWIDFMMSHKLEMSDPRGDNPVVNGLTTFGSFIIFGAIPLLPFIFFAEGAPETVFYYSVIGTAAALCALGLLKWQAVGSRLSSSLAEVLLVGGTAAVVAYYVGTFFAI